MWLILAILAALMSLCCYIPFRYLTSAPAPPRPARRPARTPNAHSSPEKSAPRRADQEWPRLRRALYFPIAGQQRWEHATQRQRAR